MTYFKLFRIAAALTAIAIILSFAANALAQSTQIDKIHFIIPGGAGGGWDGTARGTGEALTESGLVGQASYENMSGGGGGKAIGYLIKNADSNQNTLMVNSTPIVIRSLTGVFPQNFRDLTMVAGTIGDYAAFVVAKNSPYQNFNELSEAYAQNPRSVTVGGGSTPGSMDHFVPAMAFEAAGHEPTGVNYVAYDAGGQAMAALLSGEIQLLSTGFSEAIGMAQSGDVRILAVTAPERVPAFDTAPTLVEQGIDVTFVNWRGFFAPPGLSDEKRNEYIAVLEQMYNTPEWEAVRSRNGWVNIFNAGDDFVAYLEEQEKIIGALLNKLGFL